MTVNKQELAVAALCNGTVIDHIPSSVLFKVVKILGIQNFDSAVTIGNNLDSKKLGKKGIIKVADVVFPESILNRIALIAPSAVVNIIRDYKVVEKYPVTLPETLVGLVK
ncbi:MAG: aspartate carbamoyltransferase regulatory subunit, partial [Duncaniella sp.]|nr:aspartate carbamoyltransferase regulatory subunit [Duncaniella sp.]